MVRINKILKYEFYKFRLISSGLCKDYYEKILIQKEVNNNLLYKIFYFENSKMEFYKSFRKIPTLTDLYSRAYFQFYG